MCGLGLAQEKNAWKSMSFLALDVAIVFGLAAAAYTINQW